MRADKLHLWVVEFTGGSARPKNRPTLPSMIIKLAGPRFIVVEGTLAQITEGLSGFADWRNDGFPKAGKWIGFGGQELYIDRPGNIVRNALAVTHSLGFDARDEAEAEEYLRATDRVFD